MASSFATMLPSGIMTIEGKKLGEFVQRTWDAAIVPALTEYVRIPAKSPMFDREWAEHGHLDRAVGLIETWARSRPIEGLRVEVVRLDGRTPVVLLEAPGAGGETVLLYGHCDKQPEMVGWAPESGPWTPVRRGDKLYGRGVGDDGYAAFAALTAIEALQAQRVEHARCVVLIEACEESGSYDLPFYVDALAERLGTPSLVVCLDSGCGNYEQLWGMTSLRGVVGGVLTVEVLTEGVHSGSASGIVPSSFRIARQLLSRLEDERTGEIIPRDFHVEIPRERVAEAREVAKVLGDDVFATSRASATRSRGISTWKSRGRISPVRSSSRRDRSWRAMRKLEGTMPLADPEWTPSVRTSTVSTPPTTPRSEVVPQSCS